MAKKIGVIGLSSNTNVGDYLLVETTKFLLKNISQSSTFIDIDIHPIAQDSYRGSKKINFMVYKFMRRSEPKVFKIIRNQHLRYFYQSLYWKIKLGWYFKKTIRNLDALILSGGGFIKFRTQGLNYLDQMVIRTANKNGIPVMFNAVGVEGYDEKDIRCQKLKKALNNPIVKVITTRDDIETLQSNYLKGNTGVVSARVADPVLWLDSYTKRISKPSKKLIGINLINPLNFKAYGGQYSPAQIENFYKNLINELQVLDQDFVLFSNGMKVDQQLGKKLVKDLNLPVTSLLTLPASSEELIGVLRKFDILFAARMHAGITATALGLDTIGLIWSEKIEYFATIFGLRRNYFNEAEIDYRVIAKRLAKRDTDNVDKKTLEEMKQKTVLNLKDFLISVGVKDAG